MRSYLGYCAILSLQSDIAKNEYDIKAKNVEIKKLEVSTKNAYVTASIDGTVKNVKTVDKLQEAGGKRLFAVYIIQTVQRVSVVVGVCRLAVVFILPVVQFVQ